MSGITLGWEIGMRSGFECFYRGELGVEPPLEIWSEINFSPQKRWLIGIKAFLLELQMVKQQNQKKFLKQFRGPVLTEGGKIVAFVVWLLIWFEFFF
jgi:hypothetical protein